MPRTPRRFGLLDAMILVAAIAIGLTWSRFQSTRPEYLVNSFGSITEANAAEVLSLAGRPALATLARIWRWMALSVPCVTTLALGLLVVRLRKPRPRGGRVFLQPGAAACGAVAVAVALEIVRVGIALVRWLEVKYAQPPGAPTILPELRPAGEPYGPPKPRGARHRRHRFLVRLAPGGTYAVRAIGHRPPWPRGKRVLGRRLDPLLGGRGILS